jgi:hypothetical protein
MAESFRSTCGCAGTKKPAITRGLLLKLAISTPSFVHKWQSHLHQHHCGRLKDFLEGLQVLCANGAVDGAMVAGETDLHDLPDHDFVVLIYYRLLDRRTDAENRRIVRIDDTVEIGDAEHTEIGYRQGGAAHFVGSELLASCLLN